MNPNQQMLANGSKQPHVMNMVLAALCAISAFIISGCSSNPTTIATTPETFVSPTTEYQIGIGDTLNISVWRNPDLSVAVPVRPDGKVSVPLAGDLSASGKSPTELAQDITEKLSNFLKGPQVTVIVSNPASADFQRRVRVTGAVKNPISLPYRDGMTVLDLVLLANGLNDFAAAKKAKLYRKAGDKVTAYPVDLDGLLNKGRLEHNYPVHPSDVLSVPERLF